MSDEQQAPAPDDAADRRARRGTRAQRRSRQSAGSFLRELPVLLLVAFLLAFLLRTFVVQVFYIPSSSMEPTLMVDDRMVVEKLTYRIRPPERGEVVVFEGDEAPPPQRNGLLPTVARGVGQFLGVVPANARDFVKRVVGLPGDEIRIDDGRVFVNDVPIQEPYVVNEDEDDYGPEVVPQGRLFFLGDNRPRSSDSRFDQLGFVDLDQVVGRAVVVIWPLDHVAGLGGIDYAGVPEAIPAVG